MKTQITLLTLALFSLSALAADVTGAWKAEFDTQRGLQKYTFTLKKEGTSVTGKANVERDGEKREAELKEGKVEGDTITFVEPLKIQDNELRITYTGKISGDEIKFSRKVGDFGSSEATAKREGEINMIRFNIKIVGTYRPAGLSPHFEKILYDCLLDSYVPDIDLDEIVSNALLQAQRNAGVPTLELLRELEPEVVFALSTDDEEGFRPVIHFKADTIRIMAAAGASFDFDPYIY